MKSFKNVLMLAVLLAIGAFTQSCSKKDNPAAPSVPTATFTFTATNTVQTPCMDLTSGYTCTRTQTATPTSTYTITETFSPTATATATDTGTPTFTKTDTSTATVTSTPTWTGTPTNTKTATSTSTVTNTPTATLSATATSTATVTSTPTETASPTPTGSATATTTTSTAVPTATTSINNITGTVRYTGSTGVTGKHLWVIAFSSTAFISPVASIQVTPSASSGVPYSLNLPSAGTYYILSIFTSNDLSAGNPNVGDPMWIYNAQCVNTTANGLSVSGATGLDITFADSCTYGGSGFPTSSPTVTATGTLTPTGSISGTLSYSGSLTGQAIIVFASGESPGNPGHFDSTGGFGYTNTLTNGGAYTITGLPYNRYILQAYVGTTSPPLGAYADIYGTSDCTLGLGSYVTVSAPVSNINVNVGGVNTLHGMSGGVTYTGAYTYGSNSNYKVHVGIYDDASYSNNWNSNWFSTSSDATTYSIMQPEDSGKTCSSNTVYVRAWVTVNNCGSSNSQMCAGDPYWEGGPYSTSNLPGQLDITFGDASLGNTPTPTATCANTATPTFTPSAPTNYLYGTLSFSGSQTADNFIGIDVFSDANDISSQTLVGADHSTTNATTYAYKIPVPSAGTYYVGFLYTTIGSANVPYGAMDNDGPIPGSYYGLYASTCQPPATGVAVSGATNKDFSFDTTCGQANGFYGTATYSGAQGAVNACHPIVLQGYNDAGLTNQHGNALVTTNGAVYNLTEMSGQALWARAFYDMDGNGTYTPGEDAVTFISNIGPSGAVHQDFSF